MGDWRRLHRGDTVALQGSLGTVLRVASDESWADVGWWRSDGSFGWAKRQRKPELLLLTGFPSRRLTKKLYPAPAVPYNDPMRNRRADLTGLNKQAYREL